MTDRRRPLRAPDAELSGRGSEPVLAMASRALGLNETALAIWDLCDGGTSVDEMVVAVVELTGIEPDRVRDDVVHVLDQFERLDFITLSD